MAELQFKKAERKAVKIKLAVTGPSGSGKTYSALRLAAGLGKKIAVLDTENDSAQLYAGLPDIPDFDSLTMGPPFLSDKYIKAIKVAVAAGYDVLIMDSVTHQWNGEGGIMDRMDKEKIAKPSVNSYTLWAKYTPEHERFKQAIVQAPIHIIATVRSKQDYVLHDSGNNKLAPKKVGMAPVQRDQFEYEFTTVFDISMEHYASVSKDRTHLFDGQNFIITEEHGQLIKNWLASGKQPEPPPEPQTKQNTAPQQQQRQMPPNPESRPVNNILNDEPPPPTPDDFPPEPPADLEPPPRTSQSSNQVPTNTPVKRKPRNLAHGKTQMHYGNLAIYPSLGRAPEAEAMKFLKTVDEWRARDDIQVTPEIEESYRIVQEYWGLA